MKNNNYQQLTRTFQRLSRFSPLLHRQLGYVHHDAARRQRRARRSAGGMSVLQHQILTDKKVGEWLAAAQAKI
jgi:carboxypeptidase Taq